MISDDGDELKFITVIANHMTYDRSEGGKATRVAREGKGNAEGDNVGSSPMIGLRMSHKQARDDGLERSRSLAHLAVLALFLGHGTQTSAASHPADTRRYLGIRRSNRFDLRASLQRKPSGL